MDFSRKRNRPAEWEQPGPSPVLHLRFLPPHTLEKDLFDLFEPYGSVREIAMLPHKRQALVEFRDLDHAEHFVSKCAETPFTIGSCTVPVAFSTSKRIVQRGADKYLSTDKLAESFENNVLLYTVYNVRYPITIELLHRITSAFGKVVRIVMFRKDETQGMVELDTVEAAVNVKRNLSGADIYTGCCTLKVDYARPNQLTVTKNDNDAWDFDVNSKIEDHAKRMSSASENPSSNTNRSLLGMLPSGVPQNHSGSGFASSSSTTGYTGYDRRYEQQYQDYSQQAYYHPPQPYPSMNYHQQSKIPCYPRSHSQYPGDIRPSFFNQMDRSATTNTNSVTPVAMVYNMDMSRMNCDRLFNILCVYGNVLRIKFLRSHEGCAMVQMGDPNAVDRAINNISGFALMGNQIVIRSSKQQTLLDVPQPYLLPDGSPSFKDFSQSRNNRYTNPLMASKNRKYRPSRALHFWNCPLNIDFNQMVTLFTNAGAPVPIKMITYAKTAGGKSSSGVLQWQYESDALAALAICNHTEIPNSGETFNYLLKLSFASTVIRDENEPSAADQAANNKHFENGGVGNSTRKYTERDSDLANGGNSETYSPSPKDNSY